MPSSTVVLNTIGRSEASRAASLMRATAWAARSAVLMNGSVVLRNSTSSNWVSSVLPSVSAVRPVRSETKNTMRWRAMGASDTMRNRPQNSAHPRSSVGRQNVVWFQNVSMRDVERVGGKNASLGEMISHLHGAGVQVPGGFATTADAYREFLSAD